MIGIVVVTHGNIAKEMVTAVKKIVPDADHIVGVAVNSDDPPQEISKNISDSIKKVNTDDGTLILSDMFGGTPSNICLSFLEPGNIEVVSGVNLPMLIKLANYKEKKPLSDVVDFIQEYGKRHIVAAGSLLSKKKQD